LIDRNTTIPAKKSQIFSTAEDNQNAVSIRVFQGEREMAQDNKLLGAFDLVGIPSAPRGIPQIEVTFDIDANGITHVSAKDKGTGKEQAISIKSDGGLSDAEIEKMVKEAEANSAEDKKKKEKIEAVNQAESLAHQTEKNLKEYGDKIDATVKTSIENAVKDLRDTLAKGDSASLDDIKAKTEALTQVAMKLGEAMYKAQAEAQQAKPEESSNSSSDKSDEKVVDAEFKDKK